MPKKPSEEEIPAQAVEESANQAAVTPSLEARVKVRVLINGTRVAGGVAAKGKNLNVKLSEAKTLESLGKVQIIGV
jgi:hypothetical protein